MKHTYWILMVSLSLCACHRKTEKPQPKQVDTPLLVATNTTTPNSTDTTGKAKADSLRELSKLMPSVPEGYKIMEVYSAYLNLDSLKDKLIVCTPLNPTHKDSVELTIVRPLIIFIQQKDKSYTPLCRNDSVIFFEYCNGEFSSDAFSGITNRKKGEFTLEYFYHIRSLLLENKTFTFRFSPKYNDFILIKTLDETTELTPNEENNYNNGTVEREMKTNKDFGTIRLSKYKKVDIYN